MQIEHELGQGALQPCQGAGQHGKARAGDPGGGLEIQLPEIGAEIDVVADGELELARRSPAMHFAVVGFRITIGHILVWQVGQPAQEIVQPLLDPVQLAGQLIEADGEADDAGAGEQRCDVLTGRLGLADVAGAGVALRLELLGFHLQRLALCLQAGEGIGIQWESPPLQAVGDGGEIGAQEFGVEHGWKLPVGYKERRVSAMAAAAAARQRVRLPMALAMASNGW